MNSPDNDDFVQDDPLPAARSRPRQTRRSRLRGATTKISNVTGDRWKEPKVKPGTGTARTEFFLRENPVPTILGALVAGLAVGFAIRYIYNERKDAEARSVIARTNWSSLSLPFLWPLLKSAKEKYDDSAEAIRDRVHRLKKMDIGDYVEPLRERWR